MTNEEINELLEIEINNFIEKYSKKHKVSEEEARKHAIVKITKKLYKEGKLQ